MPSNTQIWGETSKTVEKKRSRSSDALELNLHLLEDECPLIDDLAVAESVVVVVVVVVVVEMHSLRAKEADMVASTMASKSRAAKVRQIRPGSGVGEGRTGLLSCD